MVIRRSCHSSDSPALGNATQLTEQKAAKRVVFLVFRQLRAELIVDLFQVGSRVDFRYVI